VKKRNAAREIDDMKNNIAGYAVCQLMGRGEGGAQAEGNQGGGDIMIHKVRRGFLFFVGCPFHSQRRTTVLHSKVVFDVRVGDPGMQPTKVLQQRAREEHYSHERADKLDLFILPPHPFPTT